SGIRRRSGQRRSQAKSPRKSLTAEFPIPPADALNFLPSLFLLSSKACHAYTVVLFRRPLMAVQRALSSVFDNTRNGEFARKPAPLGIEILSTGGSAKTLREAGLSVRV